MLRVLSYCLLFNLKNKTVDDLVELEALGLKLIYVGAENGDNEILRRIDKGEIFDFTANAILKSHEGGIKSSVMLINGYDRQFNKLSTFELCTEMEHFIGETDLEDFPRSDHVFNYLVLKSVLGKDKPQMLNIIQQTNDYFRAYPNY